MARYAAFLRGINVGGNNIIRMVSLKEAFEECGFSEVKTYIQSGNVLFSSDIKDKERLEDILEKALSKKFNYDARVLIRSKEDMKKTVAGFPKRFEDKDWKHNVIFLSSKIDSKNILTQIEIKKDIEETSYSKGVLYWSAKMETITKSKMVKLSSQKIYKEMTVRNMNTTRKMLELM